MGTPSNVRTPESTRLPNVSVSCEVLAADSFYKAQCITRGTHCTVGGRAMILSQISHFDSFCRVFLPDPLYSYLQIDF